MIDPRDVAATAAAVLSGDGHEGRTYLLTGPEAVSFGDVAQALSLGTGRPIAYVDVPEDAARAGLVSAGMPHWLVTQLIGAFALARAGGYLETSDSVRALTGRSPRTVAQFAQDHAGAFTIASAGSEAASA